ncbi:pro-kumamolisin-like protein [Streptomyces sp. TLI_235]|nr:S53 family peptidase [Streptomyces sp. TLI_235]PBC78581.1 pro-kumamolisin-like protein [Streptomyces sp. TLI_235]
MLDPSGPTRTRMRAAGRATTLAVTTAALVTGAGLPVLATAQAESIAPKRIGSAPVAPKDAVKTAAPADSTELDLSITLQPKDQVALTTFVSAVSTPGSPLYKHYLGTGEFGKRFGADPATVASVRAALTAAGLHPGELGANGLTIPVKATVAEAKKAFDTDFAGYKLADGTATYANTQAPSVRGDLAGRIAGVVGLDTTSTYKPRSVVKSKAAIKGSAAGSEQARNIGASPQLCADWKNTLSSYNMVDGRDYYSSGALAQAYNLNGIADGASGSTIAILSLENYDTRAAAAWQACNGTKTSVSNVSVDGFVNQAPDYQNGEGGETALDVDTIASLAPGASILVYQGPNTAQGVYDTYQKIVNDNRAQVVSISWGRCEAERDSGRENALNLVLQQAAAQGQSVVAAAGDAGSTDCRGSGLGNDNVLSTDSPASQPYVTGIGGTSHTGLGTYPGPISVWNRNGGSGGGGLSTRWALSDTDFAWNAQHAAEYANVCGAAAGQSCRQVPDVSALADPATGYLIFTNYDANNSLWANVYGGTSAAAPLWAALVALANSSTDCAANGPVGYLNPILRKLDSSVFNDVTLGNNDISASGKYSALAGYDLATGLGSPKGKAVMAALCQQLPSQPAGTYNPVSPDRLLDTRFGTGAPTAKVPARGTLNLQVAGRGGVPASGVNAVVLNVTVAGTTAAGYLTAWPSGKARPDSSNLNWSAGRDVPNLVTVPVGADGKVSLFNGGWSGSVDLVADVFGYYSADANGSTLTPAGPSRLLDTRYGTGAPQAKLGGKQTLDLQIPGSGVTAVVLNTTVTGTDNGGYLTVWPAGETRPSSSNLNWVKGQTVPNLVVVPVGADGKVSIYNGASASIDVLADVFGYFTKDASGGKFHNAGPKRLMDTRSGKGAPAPAPLTNGKVVHLSLNDGGALASATSVVLNVTVTDTTSSGYLNAWPGNTTRPGSSNLNWDTKGQTIANLVTVPVNNGVVDLALTSPGSANVIVDLFGYYSAN